MGKDERFHRTLSSRPWAGPALRRRPCAQKVFERWRAIYNHERPHEALDLRPPASRYQPSPRSYRETPEPIDYAPQDQVRTVQDGGRISFKGLTRRVPHAFKGRPVALRPSQADGCYDVFYRHQKIATLDFSTTAPTSTCPPCLRTGVHHLSGLNTLAGEGAHRRFPRN